MLSLVLAYSIMTLIFSLKDKKYRRNTFISIILIIGCIIAFVLLFINVFPEQYNNIVNYFNNINFVVK